MGGIGEKRPRFSTFPSLAQIFEAGNGWSVPISKKHRVIARTNYTALEVSTPHLNDVIRYQDDNDRSSGKINSEHEL